MVFPLTLVLRCEEGQFPVEGRSKCLTEPFRKWAAIRLSVPKFSDHSFNDMVSPLALVLECEEDQIPVGSYSVVRLEVCGSFLQG